MLPTWAIVEGSSKPTISRTDVRNHSYRWLKVRLSFRLGLFTPGPLMGANVLQTSVERPKVAAGCPTKARRRTIAAIHAIGVAMPDWYCGANLKKPSCSTSSARSLRPRI